jgi:hypothetical protein
LTRPTGFEAVMRVRVTRGLKVTQFHGSYYIRGTDLLALPNCSCDSVFGVELAHEEAFLTASVICVQTALLHTTSTGERRIRVHTLAAPVSQIIQVRRAHTTHKHGMRKTQAQAGGVGPLVSLSLVPWSHVFFFLCVLCACRRSSRRWTWRPCATCWPRRAWTSPSRRG